VHLAAAIAHETAARKIRKNGAVGGDSVLQRHGIFRS
jgi:hypothetical protein